MPEVRRLLDQPEAAQGILAGGDGTDDLGYAYGIQSVKSGDAPPARSSFLRIWRREGEGGFRIVVDVTLPIPEG